MACKINEGINYDVQSVTHNSSEGSYIIKLKNSYAACPEGIFVGKHLVVRKGSDTNILSYSSQAKVPVLSLQDGFPIPEYIDPINMPTSHGLGFFSWILILAAVGAGLYFLKKFLTSSNEESSGSGDSEPTHEHTDSCGSHSTTSSSNGSAGRPSSGSTNTDFQSPKSPYQTRSQASNHTYQSPAPTPQPTVHEHTTIINQQSSGIDPLTAGIIGYELGQSGNRSNDSVAQEMRENRLYEQQRDLDRDRRDLDQQRSSAASYQDDSSSSSDDSSSSNSSSGSSYSDDSDNSSSRSSSSSYSDDSSSSNDSSSSSSDDSSSSSDSSSSCSDDS